MTAMHCVEEASSLVVALGEHNIRSDIENHQAKVVLMIMIRCEDGVDKEEGVVSCSTIWLLIFASDICKEIELCAILNYDDEKDGDDNDEANNTNLESKEHPRGEGDQEV